MALCLLRSTVPQHSQAPTQKVRPSSASASAEDSGYRVSSIGWQCARPYLCTQAATNYPGRGQRPLPPTAHLKKLTDSRNAGQALPSAQIGNHCRVRPATFAGWHGGFRERDGTRGRRNDQARRYFGFVGGGFSPAGGGIRTDRPVVSAASGFAPAHGLPAAGIPCRSASAACDEPTGKPSSAQPAFAPAPAM